MESRLALGELLMDRSVRLGKPTDASWRSAETEDLVPWWRVPDALGLSWAHSPFLARWRMSVELAFERPWAFEPVRMDKWLRLWDDESGCLLLGECCLLVAWERAQLRGRMVFPASWKMELFRARSSGVKGGGRITDKAVGMPRALPVSADSVKRASITCGNPR